MMGLIRSQPAFEAVKVGRRLTQPADETPGKLLQIVPFKENEGIAGAARLLQSIHDVSWGGFMNRTNVSDHHSFEIWFDEGKVQFFLHAATERAAEKYITRVESSYSNSDIHAVDEIGFPAIERDEYAAGGELTLERHHFYPIKHFRAEGFEHDPYSEILSEMLSTEETRVVVQVVMRPEAASWSANDGSGLLGRGDSVDDVAEGLREGKVKGWVEPRIRDPSKKDREAAKIIEQQRGKYAFSVNIRILAVSPEKAEAKARAEGVAGMFTRYYNSVTEQGFEADPTAPGNLPALVDDCHLRHWYDDQVILTVDELAGAAHIPNEEIETPNVEWKRTQRGTRVPSGAVDPEN